VQLVRQVVRGGVDELMIVLLRPVGCFSVRDTTYFLGAFIMSPKGSPGGIGSKAAA
jgi:hypothetical protein